MLALLLTRLLGRVPALAGWLAASPTASGGPAAAVLTGVASAASETTEVVELADVAPIVIALIAAGGTIAVAIINNQRSRPTVPAPAPDVPAAAAVAVLEANIATVRREGLDGRAALREDVVELRVDLDRLCRRLEDHLDRGTDRVPAQRRPAED